MRLPRRSFVGMMAAAPVAGLSATTPYKVGVGHNSDPYQATRDAIEASGEFPFAKIGGRTVVLKVNLVVGRVSTTGVTTDPQVTRAVVDLCLHAGASKVLIVDGTANLLPNFGPCGYNFFLTYDPQQRIALVDLVQDQTTIVSVPNGYVYSSMYLPVSVVANDPIFISIAKLKTHCYSWASLACKNLVGLASPAVYGGNSTKLPRLDLHSRGLDESIADLNLARVIHYAVVDGVIALEGEGPVNGTPLEADLVLAGRNPVAVDRVGVDIMSLKAPNVPLHLNLLSARGRGPSSLSQVLVLGYQYVPMPFKTPFLIPAGIQIAPCAPTSFPAGQTTTIAYTLLSPAPVQVEIGQEDDGAPGMRLVRVVMPQQAQTAGAYRLQWDGRDDSGTYVPAGVYMARVIASVPGQALFNSPTARVSFEG